MDYQTCLLQARTLSGLEPVAVPAFPGRGTGLFVECVGGLMDANHALAMIWAENGEVKGKWYNHPEKGWKLSRCKTWL